MIITDGGGRGEPERSERCTRLHRQTTRKEAAGMAWEYEGLFDSIMESGNQGEDLLSNFWKNEPSAIRVGSMGYRTRTIKAGSRLEAEVYPIFGREKEKRLRAEKKNRTPERVLKNNINRAKRRLILLMECNFRAEEDLHLTLTYASEVDYQRAVRDMKNYFKRVKRLREKRGLDELKYIWSIGHDQNQRLHAHVVMNGGISRKELERMWGQGIANALMLQEYGKGLQGMANYLYKQNEREKLKGNRMNFKSWAGSRNLKQPKEHTSDSKMSKARIKRIAYDFKNSAKEIMERTYPGYVFENCVVYYSDVVDGVYIRAVLRRIEPER